METCHKCGYSLLTEKFCPQCGIKLRQNEAKNDRNIAYFPDNKSDLIGTVSKTDKNILDKKIIYRVEGNTIHLQVLGELSNHDLRILQKLISVSVKLEPPSPLGRNLKEAYQVKSEEANTALQQIQIILNESMKIDSKTGVEIKAINVGNLLVSTNELRLKEIILLGNEHYYKNEHIEAIKHYDRALEIEPENVEAWTNKGIVFGNMEKYNEAIDCYDRALEIEPKYALALYNKGVVFGNMEKYNEAIDCYDRALEIEPKYALAWNNKGVVFGSMRKFDEAIDCYDRALEIEPKYALALYNKGVALGNMKKYNEAIGCYYEVLMIEPENVEAWTNKGVALGNMEKYNEAIDCYDRALEIEPKYALALYNKRLAKTLLEKS